MRVLVQEIELGEDHSDGKSRTFAGDRTEDEEALVVVEEADACEAPRVDSLRVWVVDVGADLLVVEAAGEVLDAVATLSACSGHGGS